MFNEDVSRLQGRIYLFTCEELPCAPALERWFGIFGWPTLLYTDGATSFVARTVNELLSANNVPHIAFLGYLEDG